MNLFSVKTIKGSGILDFENFEPIVSSELIIISCVLLIDLLLASVFPVLLHDYYMQMEHQNLNTILNI